MSYRSWSYLREDETAVIHIISNEVFSSTSYTITPVFPQYPSAKLFEIPTTGNGVLIDGGKVLTIEIEKPPYYFNLTVNGFSKNYRFSVENKLIGSKFYYFPQSEYSHYVVSTIYTTITQTFAFLYGDSKDIPTDTSAIVVDGNDKPVGYLAGQYFRTLRLALSGNSDKTELGGILFTNFVSFGNVPIGDLKVYFSSSGSEVATGIIHYDGENYSGEIAPFYVNNMVFTLDQKPAYR